MVKIISTLLLCLIAFLTNAQKSNIEKTIKGLEQMVVKGILNSDTNLLKKVWAPEFLVNTPRNNIAESRAAVFLNQTSGLINYASFERFIEKMQIQKNIVITMGHEIYIPNLICRKQKTGR